MIFFRVTQNINVKTTDGTLVNYLKFKSPLSLENETIYITTYNDFNDISEIFSKVNKNIYFAKVFDEPKVRAIENFPVELGVPNVNEYKKRVNLKELYLSNTKKIDLNQQLKSSDKDVVTFAIIGGLGKSISDIVSACTALRILHKKLKAVYKNIKFDIYINASSNSYYTRDKEIYQTQKYIDNVFPLSLNSKKLCEYDYFFDNSIEIDKFLEIPLNIVDKWLFKFGIDYKKIDDKEKYNKVDISNYKPSSSLLKTINELKNRGKLLLFHPYSANVQKSIPQAIAIELLKNLLEKNEGYVIVSTLQIDSRIKDGNYIDLSKESKQINDFIYIVSQMDKILTTDTSTYHISDVFMIPTVVIFTHTDFERKIKYFNYVKPLYIKDKSKNLSKFIYENEELIINKLESWKKLKIKQIIKLLDNF